MFAHCSGELSPLCDGESKNEPLPVNPAPGSSAQRAQEAPTDFLVRMWDPEMVLGAALEAWLGGHLLQEASRSAFLPFLPYLLYQTPQGQGSHYPGP